jgi:hypothetical protein
VGAPDGRQYLVASSFGLRPGPSAERRRLSARLFTARVNACPSATDLARVNACSSRSEAAMDRVALEGEGYAEGVAVLDELLVGVFPDDGGGVGVVEDVGVVVFVAVGDDVGIFAPGLAEVRADHHAG